MLRKDFLSRMNLHVRDWDHFRKPRSSIADFTVQPVVDRWIKRDTISFNRIYE